METRTGRDVSKLGKILWEKELGKDAQMEILFEATDILVIKSISISINKGTEIGTYIKEKDLGL